MSGYGSGDITGNIEGYFSVNVSGKYSPFAGCTLKTSGFSPTAKIELRVCYGGGSDGGGEEKIGWKSFGPNTEYKNITMWNVQPGRYTVYVTVTDNTASGCVECWIY